MIRVALRVRRADAELVLADLLELAPGGVEEIELPVADGEQGVVEYAVYGAPGELPDLPDLRAAVGGALVEVSTREVPDDWSERWKRFHRPVLIESSVARAPALHVRPPWEAPSEHPGALEIVIDPAQAFGTGAHATTYLCLQLLLEIAAGEQARGAVLDVGSGSGVLAIAALKLGYGPVLALDNDRESVRAIVANAAVNGVDIDARRFELREETLPWLDVIGGGGIAPAPLAGCRGERPERKASCGRAVMLANLLRPLLIELADAMPASHPPDRLDLIASGLLSEQADEVAVAYAERLGMCELARRERGEWAALWLSRG
ncbi:MAG TPA: 50S ribosomal protein L11 methyltransferase [Solirubrobacteraceae bacterium]|jgi:ribosomal protein L11 methyltransferase